MEVGNLDSHFEVTFEYFSFRYGCSKLFLRIVGIGDFDANYGLSSFLMAYVFFCGKYVANLEED